MRFFALSRPPKDESDSDREPSTLAAPPDIHSASHIAWSDPHRE